MGEEILKPQPESPQQSWPADPEREAAAKLDETLHDHAWVDLETNIIHDDPLLESAIEKPQEPKPEPEAEAEPEEEATEEAEEETESEQEPEISEELKEAAKALGLDEAALKNPALCAMLQQQIDAQRAQEAPAPQAIQEHLEGLARKSAQVNSPEMMELVTQSLAPHFGANTPEALQSLRSVTNVLAQAAINLIDTYIPQVLSQYVPQIVDAHAPGWVEDHQERVWTRTWDTVRSDPKFSELPNMGTPEFQALVARVHSENPELGGFEPRDKQGRPLPMKQAIEKRCKLFATLATGGKPSLEEAQRFIEAGRKQATTTAKRVVAAKTLGAGRSKGEIGAKEEEDPIRVGHREYMRRGGAFSKG